MLLWNRINFTKDSISLKRSAGTCDNCFTISILFKTFSFAFMFAIIPESSDNYKDYAKRTKEEVLNISGKKTRIPRNTKVLKKNVPGEIYTYFAALASTTFPQWLIQGRVTLAHAIVIFQTNLRNGNWTTWMMRKEQLAQVKELYPDIYETVEEIQSKFRSFPKDYFSHYPYWAAFRCYGG